MGVFDRMLNLGRGALRVRKNGSDRMLSDEELEAELASVRRSAVAAAPVASTDQEPEPSAVGGASDAESEEEAAFRAAATAELMRSSVM